MDENTEVENENNENSADNIISRLQGELEMKQVSNNNMIKEKERLLAEIKKLKRANNNLKQQLEDERAFYLKEKEYYCREMSVTNKIRLKQSEDLKTVEDNLNFIRESDNLRKELTKLKNVLNETLEANYNLSVKFLRMKNTKYSLKARLKREQTENAKIISDLTQKLEVTKKEIHHIVSDKFRLPIPPSNKKYLQVIKQNMQLVHDNLSYQIQISKLFNNIERIKAEKVKNETNIRLQYARKLNIHPKQSCDKMCEACLCECKSSSAFSTNKPSETTISSDGTNFQLFSGTEFSLCQTSAMRTQSAPDFRINNSTEESTTD